MVNANGRCFILDGNFYNEESKRYDKEIERNISYMETMVGKKVNIRKEN